MSNFRQSVWIDCVDINGNTSTQSLHTLANPAPAFGSVGSVIDAMATCMDAAQVAAWLAPVQLYTPAPSSGPYSSIWDKALFTWRSSEGLMVRTVIPGPANIFLPDAHTVDLDNANVASYVAACLSALGDSGGNPLAVLVSAQRVRYTPGGI